jgi:hypothetical protein
MFKALKLFSLNLLNSILHICSQNNG